MKQLILLLTTTLLIGCVPAVKGAIALSPHMKKHTSILVGYQQRYNLTNEYNNIAIGDVPDISTHNIGIGNHVMELATARSYCVVITDHVNKADMSPPSDYYWHIDTGSSFFKSLGGIAILSQVSFKRAYTKVEKRQIIYFMAEVLQYGYNTPQTIKGFGSDNVAIMYKHYILPKY